MTPQSVQLDLARAYLEMKDIEGARELLTELVSAGYREASPLLDSLPKRPAQADEGASRPEPSGDGQPEMQGGIRPVIWSIWGGIVENEGDPVQQIHCIIDEETRASLADPGFSSREDAQAYLDAHRQEILDRGLPPPPPLAPEQIASTLKELQKLESKLDHEPTNVDFTKALELLRRMSRRPWMTDESIQSLLATLIARIERGLR